MGEGASVQVMELMDGDWQPLAQGELKRGDVSMTFTPTAASVKILFTGPMLVKVNTWCRWKWEMVQEQVLVDICSDDKDPYRFGFNGMLKDNELKGIGNSLDFGARMYDSRVARWLSLDPLAAKYPSISSYAFVANNPIWFIDPDGKKILIGKSKIEYVPGNPPPSSFTTVEAATWNNLNAIHKYDADNLEAAVSSEKTIRINPNKGSLDANTTPNGKKISFDPYMKADIKDRKGNYKGTMSSDRILDHELRHALHRIGILKRPELTEEDKNSELYKNMKKSGGQYLKEEYFNIKQDNEISEKINSEGGDEPIREDHGNLKDLKPVKETMTKEDENSKSPPINGNKTD